MRAARAARIMFQDGRIDALGVLTETGGPFGANRDCLAKRVETAHLCAAAEQQPDRLLKRVQRRDRGLGRRGFGVVIKPSARYLGNQLQPMWRALKIP